MFLERYKEVISGFGESWRNREENGKLAMPVSVRLNHAIADGFLIANVFHLLEQEIISFTKL